MLTIKSRKTVTEYEQHSGFFLLNEIVKRFIDFSSCRKKHWFIQKVTLGGRTIRINNHNEFLYENLNFFIIF